jgi:DNA-binding response OmpR family regulator
MAVHQQVILTSVKDRNQLEGLRSRLSEEGYRVISAATVGELVETIRKEGNVSLALVDGSVYDEDTIKELENLQKACIPFLVLSSQRSPLLQRDCLKLGAAGLLTIPLRLKELLAHVHSMLGKA